MSSSTLYPQAPHRSRTPDPPRTRRAIVRLRAAVLACLLLATHSPALTAQLGGESGARSPEVARTLSFLGTAVPVAVTLAGGSDAMIAPGILLGPLAGYVYAGEAGRGLEQVVVRVGVIGGTVALVMAICSAGCDIIWGDDNGALWVAGLVALSGMVGTTVMAAYDIGRVGRVVRERNERLAAVAVRPVVRPADRAAGLVVSWRP
jgi:hypothetical protein